MPSLRQIATYSRLFQLLRGRKPTAKEVCRYFGQDKSGIANQKCAAIS